MQKHYLKMLLVLLIISTACSVHPVFSAESIREDMFSSKLTRDWDGERIKLAENGITIDIDMLFGITLVVKNIVFYKDIFTAIVNFEQIIVIRIMNDIVAQDNFFSPPLVTAVNRNH